MAGLERNRNRKQFTLPKLDSRYSHREELEEERERRRREMAEQSEEHRDALQGWKEIQMVQRLREFAPVP